MSSTRHSSRFTYSFEPVVFISSSFWYFSFHLAYTIIIIIATTVQAAVAVVGADYGWSNNIRIEWDASTMKTNKNKFWRKSKMLATRLNRRCDTKHKILCREGEKGRNFVEWLFFFSFLCVKNSISHSMLKTFTQQNGTENSYNAKTNGHCSKVPDSYFVFVFKFRWMWHFMPFTDVIVVVFAVTVVAVHSLLYDYVLHLSPKVLLEKTFRDETNQIGQYIQGTGRFMHFIGIFHAFHRLPNIFIESR